MKLQDLYQIELALLTSVLKKITAGAVKRIIPEIFACMTKPLEIDWGVWMQNSLSPFSSFMGNQEKLVLNVFKSNPWLLTIFVFGRFDHISDVKL